MSPETIDTNRAIFAESMRKQLGSQDIDDLHVTIEDIGGHFSVIVTKTDPQRGVVANPYDPNWSRMPVGIFDGNPDDTTFEDHIQFSGRTLSDLLETLQPLIEQL